MPPHLSASTTAANITYSTGQGSSSNMAGSSASVEGVSFGEEIETCSLLVIDQHTFEGKIQLWAFYPWLFREGRHTEAVFAPSNFV